MSAKSKLWLVLWSLTGLECGGNRGGGGWMDGNKLVGVASVGEKF